MTTVELLSIQEFLLKLIKQKPFALMGLKQTVVSSYQTGEERPSNFICNTKSLQVLHTELPTEMPLWVTALLAVNLL